MLALKAVSRQFYLAVYETDFWYRDQLEFSHFRHDEVEHNRATVQRRDYERALADERLVRVLGHQRKSGWTFSGIQPFLVVIERIPLFYQHARRINLRDIDHGLGIAIDKLASCQLITRLFIRFCLETINLNAIAKSCPYLEDLELECLDDYRGTLQHNKNLRHLSIQFDECSSTRKLTTSLIPIDSARTLTSLVLQDCYAIVNDFKQHPFYGFHNLRHLALFPLLYETEDLCNMIIDIDIKLTEVEVEFVPRFETSSNVLISTFAAKCLQHLEKFTIRADTDIFEPDFDRIVDAITSQLLSLKEIKLVMDLKIHWCKKFARLTNLKFLHYVIPTTEDRFEDLEYIDQNELRRFGVKKTIEKAFERTFEKFAEKPRVVIEFDPYPY